MVHSVRVVLLPLRAAARFFLKLFRFLASLSETLSNLFRPHLLATLSVEGLNTK